MDEGQGFRRALKNPMVVMSLCLIAGIAVYSNTMNDTDLSEIIPKKKNRLPGLSTTETSAQPPARHESKAVQWIDHPLRDPFAPPEFDSHTGTHSGGFLRPMSPPKDQHHFVLKAVAVEDQHRSAVINRTVVYEGETIEGYQVTSIQPNGVWLTFQDKTQWLTFVDKPTS